MATERNKKSDRDPPDRVHGEPALGIAGPGHDEPDDGTSDRSRTDNPDQVRVESGWARCGLAGQVQTRTGPFSSLLIWIWISALALVRTLGVAQRNLDRAAEEEPLVRENGSGWLFRGPVQGESRKRGYYC